MLEFEDWYALNEQDLNCEAAETGLDRELDFDKELWESEKYDKYVCRKLLKKETPTLSTIIKQK